MRKYGDPKVRTMPLKTGSRELCQTHLLHINPTSQQEQGPPPRTSRLLWIFFSSTCHTALSKLESGPRGRLCYSHVNTCSSAFAKDR